MYFIRLAATEQSETPSDENVDEIILFEKYYNELKAPSTKLREQLLSSNKQLMSSYQTIPQFYHRLPKNNDCLAHKLREEARTLFLQKRSKELMDNNELKGLWALLEQNYTMPPINTEQYISYDDYLRVVRLAGDKCKYEY